MGKVVAQAIMSLDGYVAKQDNTIGRLFDWLQNGEVEIPTPAGDFAVPSRARSSARPRTWLRRVRYPSVWWLWPTSWMSRCGWARPPGNDPADGSQRSAA